jgi:hypothetical protein
MKLRSGPISTIAAGILALGALTGATAAAPASAASWTHLCIDNLATHTIVACAQSEGVGYDIGHSLPSNSSLTNWTYPSTNGAVGTIQQANTDLCMQVDWAAGGVVVGAACVDDQAEYWVNIYDTTTKRTMFESVWALDNEEGNLYLTLGSVDLLIQQDIGIALQMWGSS